MLDSPEYAVGENAKTVISGLVMFDDLTASIKSIIIVVGGANFLPIRVGP